MTRHVMRDAIALVYDFFDKRPIERVGQAASLGQRFDASEHVRNSLVSVRMNLQQHLIVCFSKQYGLVNDAAVHSGSYASEKVRNVGGMHADAAVAAKAINTAGSICAVDADTRQAKPNPVFAERILG